MTPLRRKLGVERPLVLFGLVAATGACVALEATREVLYGLGYRFLLWNLILAWIPLLLSLVVYDSYRRSARIGRLLPLLGLWLLFLPNAPYIATDIIHVRQSPAASRLYDLGLVGAAGATGVLLGFASLFLVHCVLRHRFGSRRGWAVVAATLALTSAGVYVGRFLRWNSWDLVSRPGRLVGQLLPHLADQSAVARAGLLIALTAGGLGLGYTVFYRLLAPARNRKTPPGEKR